LAMKQLCRSRLKPCFITPAPLVGQPNGPCLSPICRMAPITSAKMTLRFAVRFIKDGGAQAVKLEGGRTRVNLIRRMLDAEIPVMGHIGLTPQSVHRMGGYKVQGRVAANIEKLLADAVALDHTGVFAMVLEGIPREVAKIITDQISTPTLGIGAGPDCDGQVLVLNDLLGLTFKRPAKFVRQYLDGSLQIAT